jgi:hypothetical protein
VDAAARGVGVGCGCGCGTRKPELQVTKNGSETSSQQRDMFAI